MKIMLSLLALGGLAVFLYRKVAWSPQPLTVMEQKRKAWKMDEADRRRMAGWGQA